MDIRLSNNNDQNDFEIRHGIARLGSFKRLVMDRVRDFLIANPSETIMMTIKKELDPLDTSRLERLFIKNSAYRFYQGICFALMD